MLKAAIIRFKQKALPVLRSGKPNPQYRAPMRVENIIEIGEGAHFVHVFCQPSPQLPISEINFHHDQLESVTVVDEEALAQPPAPLLVNEHGDEVQSAEQHPVTVDDAGSTPVVPAISEA